MNWSVGTGTYESEHDLIIAFLKSIIMLVKSVTLQMCNNYRPEISSANNTNPATSSRNDSLNGSIEHFALGLKQFCHQSIENSRLVLMRHIQ